MVQLVVKCITSCFFKFLGICGGSASGKTTVANKIIESLGHPWVTLLSMDSFYKVTTSKFEFDFVLNANNNISINTGID
jgi:uridine kinase